MTTVLTKKWYTKQPMKAFIELQPDGLQNYIQLARDRDDKGTKTYHCIPSNEVENIRDLLNTNSHLYEILPPDVPVKLYFDLEMERTGITSEDGYQLVNEFITLVIKAVSEYYQIDLSHEDFLILDACREHKISFHLIVQNKIYFKSILAMKQFIVKFHPCVQINERFAWKTSSGENRVLMDIIPYGTDQVFRCINQTKKGKTHLLRCSPGERSELREGGLEGTVGSLLSLIRLYYGVGDRLEIEFNESVGIGKNKAITNKPRNTKRKIDKINENETTKMYETEGLTLLEEKGLTYKDIQQFPEWKQYLYLIPNTIQHITVYKNIGFAIRNVGGTQEDYRSWARLSNKYTVGRNVDRFHTFLTGDRAFQLPFLKDLAKQSHPGYFDKGIGMLSDYFKLDFKDIPILTESCQYLSMDSKNIFSQEKLMLLIARLGGGKTQAIKKLIHKNKYTRVLFVSPRISFSQFISKEVKTALYLDEGVNLNTDVLTCSVESLYRLKDVNQYDLIVLDEIEAILSFFSSSTCKHQLEIWNLLVKFVNNSKKTIFAGAFITQKTIDFITSFKLPTICIKNEYKPVQKLAIEIPNEIFIFKLLESIKLGEKNYCCYSSLKQIKNEIAI